MEFIQARARPRLCHTEIILSSWEWWFVFHPWLKTKLCKEPWHGSLWLSHGWCFWILSMDFGPIWTTQKFHRILCAQIWNLWTETKAGDQNQCSRLQPEAACKIYPNSIPWPYQIHGRSGFSLPVEGLAPSLSCRRVWAQNSSRSSCVAAKELCVEILVMFLSWACTAIIHPIVLEGSFPLLSESSSACCVLEHPNISAQSPPGPASVSVRGHGWVLVGCGRGFSFPGADSQKEKQVMSIQGSFRHHSAKQLCPAGHLALVLQF